MNGCGGIQKALEAYAFNGLAQGWQPVIKIVRTTNIFTHQFGSWRHNEETIIVRKQIKFMGRSEGVVNQ